MNKRGRRFSNRKALLAGCMATIALVVLCGLELTNTTHIFHKSTTPTPQSKTAQPTNTVNYAPPTTEESQAGDQTKQQNLQDASSGATTPPSQTTVVNIARVSQASPGQSISLRTTLSNTIIDGQCVVTFTLSGQTTVTQTVGIVSNPTYYSCDPVDLSANKFSTGGTWQVSVYVEKAGAIVSNKATGTVQVQP